jgi:hypothetical protein
MSKPALKKELQKLSKEQLLEHILDLYEKNKSVKEFYEFFLHPESEKELCEKFKKIIRKEFDVENPMRASLKYSIAKRAISDFCDLQPSPELLADAMLTLPECACKYTFEYGDMPESFYNSACNSFAAALAFISKNNLLKEFQQRARQCVEWASVCGYGFCDEMSEIYFESD